MSIWNGKWIRTHGSNPDAVRVGPKREIEVSPTRSQAIRMKIPLGSLMKE